MDFKLFQKCFKEYQVKFGLTGWKVYFKHEKLEKCFASIDADCGDMVATIRFNKELPRRDGRDIKVSAKHEAIHLLLMRLEGNARYRFASATEIYEAVEELTVKLEGLIT